MALNIKSEDADRLARELIAATGESLTEAVTIALAERLARVQKKRRRTARDIELDQIIAQLHALPVVDPRSPDEIIGYNDQGLFD
jgi:antitoxin VapB